MEALAHSPLFKLAPRPAYCFSILFCGLLLSGCWLHHRQGTLIVESPTAGKYEVFKVAHDRPLQLVSEIVGEFNRPIRIDPGRYIVLADCSSQTVIVKSERETKLVADAVHFKTPADIDHHLESFVIQCNRHEQTQTRQRLVNQFQLHVLRGRWDILAGMTPFEIPQSSEPKAQSYSFDLAALRVASANEQLARYFVSPSNSLVTLTESQVLGGWMLLMPGRYEVELNGSSTEIDLSQERVLTLEPAQLRVEAPEEADLSLAQSIQGNPISVEINGGHWLNLNETYPVLPGSVRLRLYGSETEHEVQLVSGQISTEKVRGIIIKLHCPPWDWSCLGSRKIFLYNKDAHYPFARGITDVPLLYFEDDAWLTIEGSREIRFQIPKTPQHFVSRTSTLRVLPQPEFKQGVITDLVRIESNGQHFAGNTLDLTLDADSTVYLLPGSYDFVQYTLSTSTDGERRKQSRRIDIAEDKHFEFPITVYLSEKKMQSLAKKSPKLEIEKRIARKRLNTQKYRTPRPVSVF